MQFLCQKVWRLAPWNVEHEEGARQVEPTSTQRWSTGLTSTRDRTTSEVVVVGLRWINKVIKVSDRGCHSLMLSFLSFQTDDCTSPFVLICQCSNHHAHFCSVVVRLRSACKPIRSFLQSLSWKCRSFATSRAPPRILREPDGGVVYLRRSLRGGSVCIRQSVRWSDRVLQ